VSRKGDSIGGKAGKVCPSVVTTDQRTGGGKGSNARKGGSYPPIVGGSPSRITVEIAAGIAGADTPSHTPSRREYNYQRGGTKRRGTRRKEGTPTENEKGLGVTEGITARRTADKEIRLGRLLALGLLRAMSAQRDYSALYYPSAFAERAYLLTQLSLLYTALRVSRETSLHSE